MRHKFLGTGDAGYHDEDGYLYVMGRVDDIINVAGHRLSTGGMVTKLQAAQLAVKAGIPVNIASGRKAGLLHALVAGKRVGTYFPAK